MARKEFPMDSSFNIDNMNGKTSDESTSFDIVDMNRGKCEGKLCDITDINCTTNDASKRCAFADQNCCTETN